MKKIFTASMIALMAFAGVAWAAVDWGTTTNIAQGKKAYVSSVRAYDWDKAESLTDGSAANTGNAWQALGTQEGGADNSVNNETNPRRDWAYVDLGKTYQLTSVDPVFGDCYPVKFEVYATNTDPEGTLDPKSWTKIGEGGSDAAGEVNIPITTEVAYKYVGIYVTEYTDIADTWGTNINELRMTGEAKLDYEAKLTSLEAFASAEKAYLGQSVTLSYEALDQEKNEFDAEVEWAITPAEGASIADGKLTATAAGTYSVVAKSGDVASEPVKVTFAENVAQGKTIAQSTGFGKPANAIDGDWAGAAAGGDGDETEGNLVIDLADVYELTSVTLNWNWMAYAKNYTISVTSSLEEEWTVVAEVADLTLTAEQHQQPITYALDEAVEARYIQLAYDGLANDAWGAQVYEIAAEGTKVVHEDAALKDVVLTASADAAYLNEGVNIVVSYNDQYGSAIEVENVEWTIAPAEGATLSDEGIFTATKVGTYTLSVTADGVKSNEVKIEVTVDPNIAKGKSVTITNEDGETKDGAAITDGNITSFSEAGGVPNTAADDYVEGTKAENASVVIDLGGHYDLTSIEVYLGEFYPTLFSVAVSADGKEYTTVKAEEAVTENNAHFTYETTAEGIQYIKILPQTCNNAYKATRISEVKVYGELSESDKIAKTSEAGAAVETYAGVWVEGDVTEAIEETTAAEVDLTAVTGLPEALPTLATPNALYYVAASAPEAVKAQANVVVADAEGNFKMQNLVLEDGEALTFTKAADKGITVSKATVKRDVAANTVAAIYLPFTVNDELNGVKTYFPQAIADGVLRFGSNGMFVGGHIPALIQTGDEAISEIKTEAQFTLKEEGISDEYTDNVLTANASFQPLEGDAIDGAYGLRESEGKFVQMSANKNNKVLPFHSYIKKDAVAATTAEGKVIFIDLDGTFTAITGVNAQGDMKAEPVYNLAGQRVSKVGKGLYIVGGKKVYIQ